MGPDTWYLLVLQIGSTTPISAIGTIQGASGIDARFSKLDFSSEKWVRVMKFDLLIL
jgi:hypothetical protein